MNSSINKNVIEFLRKRQTEGCSPVMATKECISIFSLTHAEAKEYVSVVYMGKSLNDHQSEILDSIGRLR